ncbi:MAG: M16 family metallopeptidase [Candidatus Latescibacterota bacterium]
MRIMICSALGLTACSLFFACAGSRSASRGAVNTPGSSIAPFAKTTLKNGLTVIVKEVRSAPIVAVYLWSNTGSVNEEERVQGISHFYEHMFFKGTEKRGVGEIDRAIKSLGGYNNAFTSKEYTAYYVVLPSENFSLAADVLVDAIRHSKFPEEEIQKEMGVIKEEINRKEDDPTGKLYEEIFKIMFPGTPYAHPVLGSKETVSSTTREDFRNYLGKYYSPNNLTAVVVGDVKAEDAIREFERLTADWKPNPEVDRNQVPVKVEYRKGVRGFTLEKDVNMSYVMMAFQTAGLSDARENAVMDVASTLLGEGKSSRLYRRIVERDRIATSVSAFIYPLRYTGLLVVSGTMDREQVPKFRDAVLEEIEKLRGAAPGEDELKKAKTMLKADFAFGNETNSDIAGTLGYYHTLGILDRVTEYEQQIETVTADDIRSRAFSILDPTSYSFGVINQRIPSDREVRGE